VGCWSHDPYGGHTALAKKMGVPEELLRLADGLFEALPDGEFQKWPRRFANAIEPGADLHSVWAQVLQWLLFDPSWGLAALGRRQGREPVFEAVEAYFDWQTEGLAVPQSLEKDLNAQVDEMVEALKHCRTG